MTTTVTPVVLQPGATLGLAAVTVIQGAPNQIVTIKRAVVTNTTGTPIILTAYRVPALGTPVAGNEIIPGRSVAANATDLCPELAGMVLNAGETIQMKCGTANAGNVFASGLQSS